MLNKTNQYLALAAVCMLTLSACSSDESQSASGHQGNTPIELTVGIIGDNSASTRSVVTTDNPYGHSAVAFDANTTLYMVMKSDNAASEGGTKYSRTIGTVEANNTSVSFTTDYVRYWEGSYGRNSELSVYSACIPGKATALSIGGSDSYSNNSWSTEAINTTITWPLSGTAAQQDADFLESQDLCFSNNVSDVSGGTPITFNTTTNKFNTGNMIFYHALTWITFKIQKGAGFGNNDSFDFTNTNENIVLKGFNTSGTFTISEGEFTSSTSNDITSLARSTEEGYDHVLDGLILPGTILEGTDNNQIYFTIANNTYHLTKNQLQAALSDQKLSNNTTDALTNDHKMRAGVHYIFILSLGKTKVDHITASVVPWEEVTANVSPTNSKVNISLLNQGNTATGFDLYRSANTSSTINDSFESYAWTTDYTTDGKATLTETSTSGTYETNWYWPDNKTFYHFRTVSPTSVTVTANGSGDYITLTGKATNYTDVCWGAPFNALGTDVKLTYDPTSKGFDGTGTGHQISKAIGPTTDAINLEMFHMMSEVKIHLTTTDGDDKVTLEGATIILSNIYPTAQVLMANGLVTPTGDVDILTITDNTTYGVVPQSLENVVLTITTTDNNQYQVNMKDVIATTVTSNLIANPYSANGGKIDRWYPNFKYTYSFNLAKTAVQVTATLAEWTTVNANEEVWF